VHPYQHEKLPYDADKDILPIARVTNTILGIGVPASMGIASLEDMVKRIVAEPGKMNVALVPGITEFVFDGWVNEKKLSMVKVPYRDIVQAGTDVGEGRIQFMMASIAILQPGLQGGRIKLIATNSATRNDISSGVQTVREAGQVTFELWSDAGHRFAAKLRELSPSADPMTRTYPARFSVIDPPEFIGLGMTATLSFERPDEAPVAEVPLSAIFQRGTQPAVWVVDRQSGSVALRPVTIARWRDDTAAIASGVKDGEIIATAGVHKLEAGQKVKPVQQAAR